MSPPFRILIGRLMSKKKPKGKVLRVDPLTWNKLKELRLPEEKITALLRRVIGLPHKKLGVVDKPVNYCVPSDLYTSLEEARGAAVLKAVRSRSKQSEEPIEVRAV